MTILAYVFIMVAAFVFSQWTFNRAAAMGGLVVRETALMDVLFALSVILTIIAVRILAGT